MPGQIFVSYSHTDSDYVRALVVFLRGQGFDVWIDEGIDIGSQWITVVRGQVDTCAAFVPVMTPSADESTWVARELERADAAGRPVLPLLLDGQPLGELAGLQYEDVRGGRMPSRRFLDRLAAVVGLVATAPPATTAPPAAPTPAPALVSVVLEDAGAAKIPVIRVVRELTGLGLKEAKDLVERAPVVVLTGPPEQARHAAESLRAQRARVSLR